jgi:hypothetical protein
MRFQNFELSLLQNYIMNVFFLLQDGKGADSSWEAESSEEAENSENEALTEIRGALAVSYSLF